MTRQITYAEAVRILGAGRPPLLKFADRLLGGAVVGGAALMGDIGFVQLLDIRGELTSRAEPLLAGLAARLRGTAGRSRTELMVAAHTVLVVESFFNAFARVEGAVATSAGLDLRDQLSVAGGRSDEREQLVASLLTVQPPLPSPTGSREEVRTDLIRYYTGMGHLLIEFLRGLAVWDSLNDEARQRVEEHLTQTLPTMSADNYDQEFRRLCLDCPEFELWQRLVDSTATRELIRRLEVESAQRDAELRASIDSLRRDRPGIGWAERVARSNSARMDLPIAPHGSPASADRPVIPTLNDGFVMPSCNAVTVTYAPGTIGSDAWWDRQPRHADASLLIRAHLSTPGATTAPMVLFGRPGSGKSVLLRRLAAELDPGRFLPVLVELRSVPADLDLQGQIETAIRQATGVTMSWPELVESTDALPVLLLDGFDELLQASFGSRSDYLERIVDFQQREAGQERLVAVIVTSRTVVAEQATYPPETVAGRLAPFDFQQIGRWLAQWNRANEEYFRRSGRQPLAQKEVLVHAALAAEPLLLQMLALYDAETGALPRTADALDATDLYERLLRLFVEREVRRIGTDERRTRTQAELDPDRELDRLAIASLAMFNRHRQHATEAEIHDDLVAVMGVQAYPSEPPLSDAAPLAGRLLIGRFFFIHESQRIEAAREFRSYEFLHATFGEYLIARHVARAVRVPGGIGNGIWDLLSWAPLSDRTPILGHLRSLIAKHEEVPCSAVDVVRAGLDWWPEAGGLYRPGSATSAYRIATATANAFLLGLCMESEIDMSDVTDVSSAATTAVAQWRRLAMTWRSTLGAGSWAALADVLVVERARGDEQTLRLRLAHDVRPARPVLAMEWALDSYASTPPPPGLHREDFLCDPDIDVLVHTAEAAVVEFPQSSITFRPFGGHLRSLANVLIALRLSSSSVHSDPIDMYRSAFAATRQVALGEQTRILELLADQLELDARTMRSDELTSLLNSVLLLDDMTLPTIKLSRIVIQALGHADDIQQLTQVLQKLLSRAVRHEAEAAHLYVELARTGLATDEFIPEWSDAGSVLRQFDPVRLAQTDPVTVVELVRLAAETKVIDDQLLEVIGRALPALAVGSLHRMPQAVLGRAMDYVPRESRTHVQERLASRRPSSTPP